jgi:hypothetical protein
VAPVIVALIVVGSVLAYLAIGAVYARSQAVAAYQRAKTEWDYDSTIRESVHLQLGFRLFLWPIMLPFDLGRATVRGWMTAPIAQRKARAEQLRADADQWRDLRRSGSPQEREMAGVLVDLLEQRAREVDL